MRFKIVFPIFLALLSACWVANAEQLYKVEIIVFSHVTPAALNSEHWPAKPHLPAMNRVRNLQPMANEGSQRSNYQIMLPSELDMSTALKKLKVAKDYPPLVHVAWIQPGRPIRNSPRIHIFGGQAYDASGQPINVTSPLAGLQNDANDDAISNNPQTAANWQLNGYVRISKPYLFQIDTDLVLTIPRQQLEKLVPSVADDIKSDHFVMQQTFRMKLGELYYIDHPLFGILVEVNKYPLPNSTKTHATVSN